jgi:hypothetical protein
VALPFDRLRANGQQAMGPQGRCARRLLRGALVARKSLEPGRQSTPSEGAERNAPADPCEKREATGEAGACPEPVEGPIRLFEVLEGGGSWVGSWQS